MREKLNRKERKLTPLRLLTAGFLLNITVGTVLLMLPIANKNAPLSFLDALFTATSAGCVTGLAVADTYTQFSLFGQIVLLFLIQIGGLGFIAITSLVMLLIGKRIGLGDRILISESFSTLKVGGAVRLVRKVWTISLICELVGALLLSIVFVPQFGIGQGLWFGLFHSVSAFCNAGFDLMGGTSLMNYVDNPIVNLTVVALIVIGGLGFIVWDDLLQQRFRFKKLCLQSKVVLTTSAILIFGGTALYFILEHNFAFSGMSAGQKFLASLFQAVTTRTAGFNTVDLNSFSESGSLLTMIFMFIGAAPGSTGGGIKMTTVAVVVFALVSFLRNREGVNMFNKRVPSGAVTRAFNSFTVYTVAVVLGTFLIALQGQELELVVFEVISAVATVGLSRGATAEYETLSKIVTIILMFAGRVGGLTMALAVADMQKKSGIMNVEENIITG